MTEVIDNFLSDYDFKSLTHILMGNDFPWYYNEDVVYDNDNQYQFTHAIHTCKGISPQNDIDYTSPYFDFFKPFVYKTIKH